jgi:soluble lytic murein transglycosylase-like protein
VASVAPVYPVPPALVKAVIKRESNFNPEAKSSAGAIGLMQVMPFNAAKVNLTVADLSAPETNILAGTRPRGAPQVLHGDVIDALVAYNARPGPLRPDSTKW